MVSKGRNSTLKTHKTVCLHITLIICPKIGFIPTVEYTRLVEVNSTLKLRQNFIEKLEIVTKQRAHPKMLYVVLFGNL